MRLPAAPAYKNADHRSRGSMIVVTGGAGFVGSNLIAGLEAAGRKGLVVCDRLGGAAKWRNIAKRDIATIIAPGELMAFLEDTGAPIEAVFHLAEDADDADADVDALLQANYHASAELWAWCAGNGVRLIYCSTAETYGDGADGFEDDIAEAALARLKPGSAIGWTRHLFDRAVARTVAAGARCPPQWAGLKLFDPYGPNEYHRGAKASLPLKAWRGAARLPDARRDYIWIGDCVAVMIWLLDNPRISGLFNLGTGQARGTAEVTAAVAPEREFELCPAPSHGGDGYQYYTQASMTRLRGAGYDAPLTPLDDGVARYLGDFLAREDPYL